MRTFPVVLCLMAATFQAALPANLPSNWKQCRRSDPDINKCLSVAVLDAIKKMGSNGVPALTVNPIDPLGVTEIKMLQGAGPIRLNLALKDMKILGITKSSIIDYKANLNEYKLYTKSLTPAFRIVGNYEVNGQILLLPVRGKGKCNLTLFDLETEHFLEGELIKSKGKEYMKLKNYNITLKPKNMTVNLENLFNGDKVLGDNMNRFINENWDIIFAEMKSTFQQSFGALFMEVANNIFTKVPFNDIFLP